MYFIKQKLIISAFFLFCSLGFCRTLLIYAGVPRGGSGDVAANWIMAKYLKAIFPQDRIVLVVDEEIHEQVARNYHDSSFAESVPSVLSRLIPNYRVENAQTIEGIEIISAQRHSIPQATYSLVFSTPLSETLPEFLVQRSKMALFFNEPSRDGEDNLSLLLQDSRERGDETVENLDYPSFGLHRLEGANRGVFARLPNTAGTEGMYTLPIKISPSLTRKTPVRFYNSANI